jgi:hypothetical protein
MLDDRDDSAREDAVNARPWAKTGTASHRTFFEILLLHSQYNEKGSGSFVGGAPQRADYVRGKSPADKRMRLGRPQDLIECKTN